MDETGDRRRLPAWAWASLALLAVVGGLWVWAGITTVEGSGRIEAGGGQATALRDDGLAWQVTEFRVGRRVEAHVEIRPRGPLPVAIRSAPEVAAGPPRPNLCGWWPDQLLLDGEPLGGRDLPYPLPRDEPTELILSGTFLGEPGCLDQGRIGAHRLVPLRLSILGAPKPVRVRLPVVHAWSNDPDAAAAYLRDRSVTPRVGTAP